MSSSSDQCTAGRIGPIAVAVLLSLTVMICSGESYAEVRRDRIGAWDIVCETNSTTELNNCNIVQTIRARSHQGLDVTTIISRDASKRFNLKIATPLDRSLREGIGVQVDDNYVGAIQYSSCNEAGCLAKLDDANNLVSRIIGANAMSYLIYEDSSKKGTFLKIPLDGIQQAVKHAFVLQGSGGAKAIANDLGAEKNNIAGLVIVGNHTKGVDGHCSFSRNGAEIPRGSYANWLGDKVKKANLAKPLVAPNNFDTTEFSKAVEAARGCKNGKVLVSTIPSAVSDITPFAAVDPYGLVMSEQNASGILTAYDQRGPVRFWSIGNPTIYGQVPQSWEDIEPQDIDAAAMELYLSYRWQINNSGQVTLDDDLDAVDVVVGAGRIKF